MSILAMYDAMKIQDYIFGSNKLKENLGASIIVQKMFEEWLPTAIEKVCVKEKIVTEWKCKETCRFLDEPETLDAEVVYAGGGNTLVLYRDKETACKVNKALSAFVLEMAGCLLPFAYVDNEITNLDSFKEDQNALLIKMKKKKNRSTPTFPMMGLGITRLSMTDGLPVVQLEDGGLSAPAKAKGGVLQADPEYFQKRIKVKHGFPIELDSLGQKQGENYIAVVHIDGNNMGAKLNEIIDKVKGYKEAIQLLREFAKKVDSTFVSIFKRMVEYTLASFDDKDFHSYFDTEKLVNNMPIRPIVLNGDDVTFVCNGKIGISLANYFLKELHSVAKIIIGDEQIELSACAGVAIVKSHFPFYRAYQLAEDLCGSAKMKAKILNKEDINNDVGSWVDFHIVQSGVTTDLFDLRSRDYQVPGMQNPGEIDMLYNQHNLLWRPWAIAGDVSEDYKWEYFESIWNEFKSPTSTWKRSRIKKLRNAMITSEQKINQLLREFNSRNIDLPEFCGWPENTIFRDDESNTDDRTLTNYKTPYFDALELIDLYLPLPIKDGGTK